MFNNQSIIKTKDTKSNNYKPDTAPYKASKKTSPNKSWKASQKQTRHAIVVNRRHFPSKDDPHFYISHIKIVYIYLTKVFFSPFT